MKAFRKLLVKILGLKGYLRLVSKIYIQLIRFGFFKKKYAELHFINQLLKPNDVVIDIGANLGYYSYFISKKIGNGGKLYAVEPIPLFVEVWQKNMHKAKYANYKMLNYAMGENYQENVTMSIPIVNGVVRHGLTKIIADENTNQSALTFSVTMQNGDKLIAQESLAKLDFIKCDVEGYEQFVIPSLQNHINKYKPTIQVELAGDENKTNVANFLVQLGYQINILKDAQLVPLNIEDIFNFNQDFYFVHPNKLKSNQI